MTRSSTVKVAHRKGELFAFCLTMHADDVVGTSPFILCASKLADPHRAPQSALSQLADCIHDEG
jgi:hypothetical protein